MLLKCFSALTIPTSLSSMSLIFKRRSCWNWLLRNCWGKAINKIALFRHHSLIASFPAPQDARWDFWYSPKIADMRQPSALVLYILWDWKTDLVIFKGVGKQTMYYLLWWDFCCTTVIKAVAIGAPLWPLLWDICRETSSGTCAEGGGRSYENRPTWQIESLCERNPPLM